MKFLNTVAAALALSVSVVAAHAENTVKWGSRADIF